MIRLLIKLAIFFGSAALGIFVASLLLEKFHVSAPGFIVAIAVFAIVQSLVSPIMNKLTQKYATALTGGVGLISTFIALLVASLFSDGLKINGISTWILATLVVWIVTAFGAWLIPLFVLKKKVKE